MKNSFISLREAPNVNTLRKICAATILSLTLAGSALAGHIDTPGAPAPVSSTNSGNTADGIVLNNAGGGVNNTITTSIVQTILSVIYR